MPAGLITDPHMSASPESAGTDAPITEWTSGIIAIQYPSTAAMPVKRLLYFPVLLFVTIGLISCGPMRKVGSGTASVFKKSTASVATGIAAIPKPPMPDFSLADLMPGPKIKVVEVREKDLKEMPTGTELAKAHRSQGRGQGFMDLWPFSGKLYFEEPDFPAPGAEMDGSLLPPKLP